MEEFIQNLIEQKKRIAISALSIIAGAAILIGSMRSGPDALSYARAESAFSEWNASPENEQLYLGMRKAMQDVPSLQKKYEPAIAQKLFSTARVDEALIMAERSLKRVRNDVPFHSDYAATSLVIQRGGFQQALEQAVALKERMKADQKGAILYAYNLFRIASLQQELKNRPGEKAGWEELESYLADNGKVAEVFMNGFAEEKVLLKEYILERKRAL